MARILQPRQEKGGASRREAIETTGEVFSDGTTLGLIRLDSGAGETSLLRWDGKNATIGQQFEVNDKVYRAPQMNSTFLRALRLPRHIASYGSTRGLFNDICKVFTQYTDIAEEHVWLIAYFGLANWLADRLLVAPFLFVIAPLGTPRSRCAFCLAAVAVR